MNKENYKLQMERRMNLLMEIIKEKKENRKDLCEKYYNANLAVEQDPSEKNKKILKNVKSFISEIGLEIDIFEGEVELTKRLMAKADLFCDKG